MPDISMCLSDDCPLRRDCYRNEASGTRPSEFRQSWIAWTWRPLPEGAGALCDGFWITREAEDRQSRAVAALIDGGRP